MRRLQMVGMALTVASGLLAAGAIEGGAKERDASKGAPTQSFNARTLCDGVARRTNKHRRNKGLRALRVDKTLQRAAQRYADFYARNPGRRALWGHGYGGNAPMDRAENAGFKGGCVGENLFWMGEEGALPSRRKMESDAMASWLASRSHRKNIERAAFDVTGLGAARFRLDGMQWVVVVQMFGCSRPLGEASRPMRIGG